MKKKSICILLIISLVLSFIITNKISILLVNNDELMRTIKRVKEEYNTGLKEAIISDDTFIPGINGQIIDEKKSYNVMKKYGVFSKSLLVFKEVKPNYQLKDNINKYIISGNTNKKMVSLIFLIHEEDNINDLFSIINEKNIEANLFVDGYFLEKNGSLIQNLDNNYVIGNLSYNGNYNDGAYIWMDTIIKKYSKQKYQYCYLEEKNDEYLNICSLNDNLTIMPSLILKNNYYEQIKTNINNGMIISLDVNNILIKELKVIINYIENKGYRIVNLDNLLNEDINLKY